METIEALFDRYHVDKEHAQHVMALAVGLYDATQSIHRLDARMRELLEAAALLHNVGLSVDEPNHHTAGRDIVVATPLAGFDQTERVMLACMVGFHRKAVQAENEPLYAALGEAHRRPTLILSALLRIADGLDYSQTQTTHLAGVELVSDLPPKDGPDDESDDGDTADPQAGNDRSLYRPEPGAIRAIRLRVQGPHSYEDAARATRKADLWGTLFSPMAIGGRMTRPGLAPDMTLAEAGRRVLLCQLDALAPDEWVLPPDRALSADCIQGIRPAVARMRATLREFGPFYRNKGVRPVEKALRALSGRLERLNEQDARIGLLKSYVRSCGAAEQAGAEHLLAVWRSERKEERAGLADVLGSKAHARWLKEVGEFAGTDAYDLATPPGKPSRVRHTARLVQERSLARVRSYDVFTDAPATGALRGLKARIEQLRYLTEGLQEVLPADRGEPVIARCVAAQDAVGAICAARLAAGDALRYLGELDPLGQNAAPDLMSGAAAFADRMQKLAEERTHGWRQHLEPLLMI